MTDDTDTQGTSRAIGARWPSVSMSDIPPAIHDRFWKWVNVCEEDVCWRWTSTINTSGYGIINDGRNGFLAHRLAVVFSGRTIPADFVVDHLCKNRWCVNPNHLEAVTHLENVARGDARLISGRRSKEMTVCKKGLHKFEGDNIYVTYDGVRLCKACNTAKRRRHLARKKELQNAA